MANDDSRVSTQTASGVAWPELPRGSLGAGKSSATYGPALPTLSRRNGNLALRAVATQGHVSGRPVCLALGRPIGIAGTWQADFLPYSSA